MKKQGPILIFEDDPDDVEFIMEVFREAGIKNNLLLFDDADKFIEYLHATTEQPFLILSDINVSKINGIQLKARIDSVPFLREKCIPFVFLSTSNNSKMVSEAYDKNVQGYFVKKDTMTGMKIQIDTILAYWQEALHPRDSQ